jgi:hypothetical protein
MTEPPEQVIRMTEPLRLGEEPRPDGYEPLGLGLMVYAGASGFPYEEDFWYLISASRRLDTAHHMFERVREGIDSGTARNMGGLFAILGDVELAMIALYRAVDMAYRAGTKLNVKTRWPQNVKRKQKAIEELRDAYEHIDERALGKISKRRVDKKQAHTIFDNVYRKGKSLGEGLIKDRKLTYRQWSLGIDDEATDLFKSLRDYLRDAGVEVIDRHPR